MKILIAEDSPVYRKMLKDLLQSWQYEVVVTRDGEEALQALSAPDAPRLAIVDGVMPGLSGLEFCAAVRKHQHDYVYVIILSANCDQDDVARGFEQGADDYLGKPFRESDLRSRLKVGERIIRAQQELLAAREALMFQATHDPMTKLLNHGAISQVLQKEIARASRHGTPLSVGMADLDFFKRINDTHGHMGGDEVLRQASARIAVGLREYDSLGRYGGEEFLVVLPGCDGTAAFRIADRLRSYVAESPILFERTQVNVTLSMGVCQWKPGCGLEELLRQADLALYRAKNSGRNRVELQTPGSNGAAEMHELITCKSSSVLVAAASVA